MFVRFCVTSILPTAIMKLFFIPFKSLMPNSFSSMEKESKTHRPFAGWQQKVKYSFRNCNYSFSTFSVSFSRSEKLCANRINQILTCVTLHIKDNDWKEVNFGQTTPKMVIDVAEKEIEMQNWNWLKKISFHWPVIVMRNFNYSIFSISCSFHYINIE